MSLVEDNVLYNVDTVPYSIGNIKTDDVSQIPKLFWVKLYQNLFAGAYMKRRHSSESVFLCVVEVHAHASPSLSSHYIIVWFLSSLLCL
jgi:hypothetical protein